MYPDTKQKIQTCRVISFAAKNMTKTMKLPDELMEQLQKGVQSNLNQVDSDLREWDWFFFN